MASDDIRQSAFVRVGEWNVRVHIDGGMALGGWLGRLLVAAEHLQFIGYDLGCVSLDALLVLPLPRRDLAFDVHGRSGLEVLACDLRELPVARNAVPFGLLFLLARVLVLP